MERRVNTEERRKDGATGVPDERRVKSRRKNRKFLGSPRAEKQAIDASDVDELDYWSAELGVTPDALRTAVQTVGPNLKAVRDHFGK